MKNLKDKIPKYPINEEIKCEKILLVGEDNSSNVMETKLAIEQAKEQRMDLILLNNKAEIPVAKIMDYGKFIYSLKRKSKNIKKNVIKIKSITVKPKIDLHDLQWKANQAGEWFKLGDRVLFIVKAYGRMSVRTDLINGVFEKFTELVAKYGEPKTPLKQINKIQYEVYFFPHKK